MELTGEHRIPAPRAKVWEALHDPEILKECIKGCQRLDKVDDHHMTATVQAKVGPVKATFEANVEIQNEVPPERYTLTGEGKGGVAGFAKGSADVELQEDGPDATILTYRSNATIGGKLAQIGSRLVETTARKYAADFFETFSQKVGGGSDTAELGEGIESLAPGEMAAADFAAEGGAGNVRPEPAAPVASAAPAAATPPRPAPAPAQPTSQKPSWTGPVLWGAIAILAIIVIVLALD